MLLETTLIGSIIAVKYIAALIAGSSVAGAGLGAGFFHLFSKRKNPSDDPINTERQKRQEQRQQELDEVVTETKEKLNTTFQGLETNSNAFTAALSRFKGFFANIFGRTEDLNKVVQSLEQSKDERIEMLLKSNNELSAKVENLTGLLQTQKELDEKIQGVGSQLIEETTAQQQMKQLRAEKDEALKNNKILNHTIKELSSNLEQMTECAEKLQQRVTELEQRVKELEPRNKELEQRVKELEQAQHCQETKKPGFFN